MPFILTNSKAESQRDLLSNTIKTVFPQKFCFPRLTEINGNREGYKEPVSVGDLYMNIQKISG